MRDPPRPEHHRVDRRVGGLEKQSEKEGTLHLVDRRVGGLENHRPNDQKCHSVDRRVGGLEING